MPIDYDQMRDCLLDALSQHVLSLDTRGEVIISGTLLKARTQDSVIVRGLLEGGATAFGPAEAKLFEQALWTLFSEGTLAPLFKAQRYGRGGWEEGEFKLTARGMRGFRAGASPRTDMESYLTSLRFACAGLTRTDSILIYAEQAARAVRGELMLAAAVMAGLALEVAVSELVAAYAAGTPEHGEPPGGADLQGRVVWLEQAMQQDTAVARALASSPEVSDGLGPLVIGASVIGAAHRSDGVPVSVPTNQAVEAAMAALPGCIERAGLLVRLFRVAALI